MRPPKANSKAKTGRGRIAINAVTQPQPKTTPKVPEQGDLAERIWQVVMAIPAGKVASYGDVANMAGLPGYARYVGTTLSKLPDNSSLPWYRVINSQGKISFPAGSDTYERQIKRLENEGVVVKEGKISMKIYRWKP